MTRGRRKQKNGRGSASRAANVECSASDALPATEQIECFNRQVVITITCYRVRTCDPDGLCEKFAIDAIVGCGILADDSSKYVAKVIKNAICKVKNQSDEKTVIEIEEID